MARSVILFFTAGAVPTVGEAADIAQLVAATDIGWELRIRNGNPAVADPTYNGGNLEACDYVAGTIPEAYDDVDVLDPDAIPAIGLSASQVVVDDGDTLNTATGTVTFDVTDSVLTGVFAATGTHAVVTHNVDIVVPVTGVYATKIKATVVNGVITGFVLS